MIFSGDIKTSSGLQLHSKKSVPGSTRAGFFRTVINGSETFPREPGKAKKSIFRLGLEYARHWLLLVPVVTACLCWIPPAWSVEGGVARTFHLKLRNLEIDRALWLAGDPALKRRVQALEGRANSALLRGPYSVTQNTAKIPINPSHDPHDFVGIAFRAWPNPDTPDGLPWIIRDGHHNPANDLDWTFFDPMVADAELLSLAYYITRDERYAEHAGRLLRAWFIDPDTRMNPHMKYSNIVPGTGFRGVNLPIFMIGMYRICDAAGILEASPSWDQADADALAAYFRTLLSWLETDPDAVADGEVQQNHSTYYRAGRMAMYRYLKDTARARQAFDDYVDRFLPLQFASDGTQPLEMERANNFTYHINGLTAAYSIAQLADGMGRARNLWNHTTSDGAGLRKSTEFLLPYLLGHVEWPYFADEVFTIEPEKRALMLQRAALGFNDAELSSAATAVMGNKLGDPLLALMYPAEALSLINGGFEAGFLAWKGLGSAQLVGNDVHGGKSAVLFSSAAAFSTLIRQDVGGLPAARYTASIWYKRMSDVNGAQFSVTVRRRVNGLWETQYRARSPLTTSTSWTQAVLDNIPVSDGDVLQFGVWMNLGPGGALYLDDGRLQ